MDTQMENKGEHKPGRKLPAFNFETDINKEVLKDTLRVLGFSEDELATDLERIFNECIVSDIKEGIAHKKPIGISHLYRYYGFKNEDAVKKYIHAQRANLNALVLHANKTLPPGLLEKIQSTFEKTYKELQELGTDPLNRLTGTDVLSTLFPIFELIQHLTPEEISILEAKYGNTFSECLSGNSLQTFHNDLNTLDDNEFSKKYSKCFNGMLQNTLGNVLNTEKFYAVMLANEPIEAKMDNQNERQTLTGEQHYDAAKKAYSEKNHALAKEHLQSAIALGYTKAYGALGVTYLSGLGVSKDPIEAEKLLKQGVEHGHPGAMYNLARAYEKGNIGIAKNNEQALALYQRARDSSEPDDPLKQDAIKKITLLEGMIQAQAPPAPPPPVDLNARRWSTAEMQDTHKKDNTPEQNCSILASMLKIYESDGCGVEVNQGTEKTPGIHVRVETSFSDYYKLIGIQNALKEKGLSSEIKSKGMLSILVIQDIPSSLVRARISSLIERKVTQAQQEQTCSVLKSMLEEYSDDNCRIEINPGTTDTPGIHLCLETSDINKLKGIKQALEERGLPSTIKKNGDHSMLVIQNIDPAMIRTRAFSKDLTALINAKTEQAKNENRVDLTGEQHYDAAKKASSEKNHALEKEHLQSAIALGYTKAYGALGVTYLSGLGVSKDPIEAEKLLKQGVEHGHPGAMYNLARAYEKGNIGIAKNNEQALALYQRARDSSEPDDPLKQDAIKKITLLEGMIQAQAPPAPPPPVDLNARRWSTADFQETREALQQLRNGAANQSNKVENLSVMLNNVLKSLEPKDGSNKHSNAAWNKAADSIATIIDLLNDDQHFLQDLTNNEVSAEDMLATGRSMDDVLREHKDMFQEAMNDLIAILPPEKKAAMTKALSAAQEQHHHIVDDISALTKPNAAPSK